MSTLKANRIEPANPALAVELGGTSSPTYAGNKLLFGGTVELTATAGQSYILVSHTGATTTSKAFIVPTNAAAATFVATRQLLVTMKGPGLVRFDVNPTANFAGTETFDVLIVQPPV